MTLVVEKRTTPIMDFLMEVSLQNEYKEVHGDPSKLYRFAIGIARILTDICVQNVNLPQKESRDFCGKLGARPTISVRDYIINRLLKYMKPSMEILLLALALIDKLISKTTGLLITFENVHQLLSIAIVISIKFTEDVFYTNEYYAKVAGIPPSEFSSLEFIFFIRVEFDVWIGEDIIFAYEKLIDSIVTE